MVVAEEREGELTDAANSCLQHAPLDSYWHLSSCSFCSLSIFPPPNYDLAKDVATSLEKCIIK